MILDCRYYFVLCDSIIEIVNPNLLHNKILSIKRLWEFVLIHFGRKNLNHKLQYVLQMIEKKNLQNAFKNVRILTLWVIIYDTKKNYM